MKSCDGCNEKMSIPYAVHKATVTRLERINERLWVVILILIFALIASNLAWIIYEKQFVVVKKNFKIECQQDSDGINIVSGGNVSYGTESQNKDTQVHSSETERLEPLKVQGDSEFLRTASGKDPVIYIATSA